RAGLRRFRLHLGWAEADHWSQSRADSDLVVRPGKVAMEAVVERWLVAGCSEREQPIRNSTCRSGELLSAGAVGAPILFEKGFTALALGPDQDVHLFRFIAGK